jgi:hypothetical protein
MVIQRSDNLLRGRQRGERGGGKRRGRKRRGRKRRGRKRRGGERRGGERRGGERRGGERRRQGLIIGLIQHSQFFIIKRFGHPAALLVIATISF